MKTLTSYDAVRAFINGKDIRRNNSNVTLKNDNNVDLMDAVMYIISYNDWVLVGG